MASPVLLVALVPLFGNWKGVARRRGDTFTRDWAVDVLNTVEPYGIIVTNGDNDTFPLWYAQEVEGIRQDVTVAVTSLLNTDWYVRQIIRRPPRQYDAAKGPAIYRDTQWPEPHGAAAHMTLARGRRGAAVLPAATTDGVQHGRDPRDDRSAESRVRRAPTRRRARARMIRMRGPSVRSTSRARPWAILARSVSRTT